jgi:hypothetical protein
MDKHTEGPWIIHRADEYTDDAEDHLKIMSITAQNGETILYTDSGYFKPREANARLIASAPELLEALREAFNAFAHDADGPVWADSTIAKARAAIAKATGGAS